MFEATQSDLYKGKIESDKVFIKKVFNEFWFRIPVYQRSYVWEKDQVMDLLDDILHAATATPENEYFMGSMVLQKKLKSVNSDHNSQKYTEYDVLDGQQRLTTLFILFAVIKDFTSDKKLKEKCGKYLFQEQDIYENIPARARIVYMIRDKVSEFISDISLEDGTLNTQYLERHSESKNVSVANMARSAIYISEFLEEKLKEDLNSFVTYLLNRTIFIYVSAESLDDAFRLFTILNDRGMPLSNSDILKAINLGELENEKDERYYAQLWEDAEGSFGRDEFDRFLFHIRTILIKDKARDNLLREYEDKIYNKGKLNKGIDTLKMIKEYVGYYERIIWFNAPDEKLGNEIKNLISIMMFGLQSTDWVPSLLLYFKKFEHNDLLEFLIKLCNKISADWITQLTPTYRISNMNEIVRCVDEADAASEVIKNHDIFKFDSDELKERFLADVYGKGYARFILLYLEYHFKDHSSKFNQFDYLTIEHVLPQNPGEDSAWISDFSEENREQLTHKIGNLVLIGRRKNAQLGNQDFEEKKRRYFHGNIDAFPNSLRVMECDEWSPSTITKRNTELSTILMSIYGIQ